MLRVTLTAVKADIGSIGGHIRPSVSLLDEVEKSLKPHLGKDIIDFRLSFTGDDIAILMTHTNGTDNPLIHQMAWDAFKAAADVAKEEGLYGAGQDLLKDAFSGNIRGLGPGIAEMEFEERKSEPFLLFAADKTDPGAFNLPLYLAFCDPMYNSGLLLSPNLFKGFKFEIMDVNYTEGDKVITLVAPEDLYDMAALLRDPERYVIKAIYSRTTDEIAAAASTTRLHNIAGKYVGKDDPILLVRVQGVFPATGEILQPYAMVPYVGGFMRGSHNGPLMPVKRNSTVSFFDGPPIISCTAYCVKKGKLSEEADAFDHPFWDYVRELASKKAIELRRQGFYGNAMLPYGELEYGGIVERLENLEDKFEIRH